MNYLFLELLKLSISASFLIAAVILLRLLMKKSPKWVYCILWSLVGIRLICPFSFESRFSVIPKEDVIPINTILTIPDTQSELVMPATNNYVPNEILFESENTLATNKSISIVDIISGVWLVGTIGIMLYGAISYIRLKRIVSVSINDKENIYLCDDIDVPFIFGIFKPKIYLPSNMADNQKEYVLLHEKAHLSRHDNLWKPVGFILLSIYWFNPLVWIAYHLFSKDIELATDEKVINNLNNNEIKDYSETLLACSLIKSNLMIKTCPVAFGEVGVKDRIKAVLSYKKPSFWIILIAIISCIVVGVCFLTKQKDEEKYLYDIAIDFLKEKYTREDSEHYSDKDDYQIFFDYEGFGTSKKDNNKFAYMWILEESYYAENGEVKIGSGSSMAYKITFSGDKVINIETPKDGTYYVSSINEIFPKNIANKILNYNFNNTKLKNEVNEYYSYLNSQITNNQYQNILGYDTYYIDTERSPKWYTRDYYTTIDGNDYLIMESFGFEKEREDTIKDINGDGYTELICNCVSGGDGHQEAYIYMRDLSSSTNGPSVMRCNIDYEKLNLEDFYNWGVNAFSTRYEPNNNRFAITYSKGNADKTEDVTIYINDTEIMDKLSYRKHIVEIQTNNNSIELKTYEAENDVSYTLSDSDSNIIKNIIFSGKWNKETCDGLPAYTFVYDNRKYGIEIFSSQIHITDMSGKGKGEIVCTGDDFYLLKPIIDKINGYRNAQSDGLNLENLKYSAMAQQLLPFQYDLGVYKHLAYLSMGDYSPLKEIWSKIPENVVLFNDNVFDTNLKNSGHYFEVIDENNKNYKRTVTDAQAIEIIKNRFKGFNDTSDQYKFKSQFVLFTDLYQNINREPVILVTVQGTFKTTEKDKENVRKYWKEEIGSSIIDTINLDESIELDFYLINPNTGEDYEYYAYSSMKHINFRINK